MITMLLPLLLSEPRPGQPFVFVQSTAAQSIFPFLRALCNRPGTHSTVHTFLYAPSSLVDQNTSASRVYDWSAEVPGYGRPLDPKIELLSTVKNGSFSLDSDYRVRFHANPTGLQLPEIKI